MSESFETLINFKVNIPTHKSNLWCFEWWNHRLVHIEAVKFFPGYLNVTIHHEYHQCREKPMATIKILLPHVHMSVVHFNEDEELLMFRGSRQLHCYQIEWIEENQGCKITFGFELERNRNSHMNLLNLFIHNLMEYRNEILDCDGSPFNCSSFNQRNVHMTRSPDKENECENQYESIDSENNSSEKKLNDQNCSILLPPKKSFRQFMKKLFF